MIAFGCLTTDGVELRGAVFPATGDARSTVVLAHGLPAPDAAPDPNDEGYPGLARRIAARGAHAVTFNFRGTGESGGHLDIDLWPVDLQTILDHLDTTEFRQDRYAVVGFSAGGATALVTSGLEARINPVVTLAAPADYGFLDAERNAQTWFEMYRRAGMIREGYDGDAESWAARFSRVVARDAIALTRARHVVLIHGTADEVVPVDHARQLAAAAGAKVELNLLEGVTHSMRREPQAVEVLLEALGRLGAIEPAGRGQ